jgi:endonuclease VIII-like 1
MSGRFNLTPASELYKHSHLIFTSTEEPPRALSFVDARRFGSWRVFDGWGSGRGPDPMYEHDLFATNITNNLTHDVFNKPICEVMLNQQFFNGIGNYLRAEILYRAGVPPFVSAREALSTSNIISLCQSVPLEVVHLKVGNVMPQL